ncbi:hypothetical protein [Arthrobacter zhaoguopingii]|uniref:hypothetical protein n=1 Tax=Arthrobacter zhaoguopingii TaxID=2681491 RepID=UPI00135A0A81|nr:hypothetical protein [Arthrobacter zhaoguopingii]
MNVFGKIRTGMQVFDRSGEKVGVVKVVELGRNSMPVSQLVTHGGTKVSGLRGAVATPVTDLPMARRNRLISDGFIRIDCDRASTDLFEPLGAVDRVAGSIVRLSVKHHQAINA